MPDGRPNVVFVLVDNWGWGDVSIQGGTNPTPRIDAIARAGLRLTNYNVESQCTPTRSAILTGRLPIRSGTHRVTYGLPYGLSPWERTLAELMSDAGYRTALIGKWHLGDVEGRLPTDQGFDEWFGIKNTSDEAGYSSTPQFDPDVVPQPFIWEGRKGEESRPVRPFDLESRKLIDREIVERAEDYIGRRGQAGEPFFLYLGMTQIHPPVGNHPDFDNATGSGSYSDILAELDHNIGRIADALDSAGLADDTILIISGDNGAVTERGFGGSNGPWRAGFTGYEAGLRTVAMVRWPGHIEAGRVSDEIVAALDWMPTLASLVGAEDRLPDDRPIDGIDQSAFILGRKEESERDHVLFYVGEDLFAVKWRTFKIHLRTAESMWSPIQSTMFPQVYDVRNDPGEQVDLMQQSLFAYSWVFTPMNQILGDLGASVQAYPNIKPGQDFDGYA